MENEIAKNINEHFDYIETFIKKIIIQHIVSCFFENIIILTVFLTNYAYLEDNESY